MKRILIFAVMWLPVLAFCQQPLKNQYGKYVEVSRQLASGKVFLMINDKQAASEMILAKKEQLDKRQLKKHLRKNRQYPWQGSIPEVMVLLEGMGYEFVDFVPIVKIKTSEFSIYLERMIFKRKE